MQIREIKEEFPWTTSQSENRSKGLHLSDVIHDMGEVLFHTGGRIVDEETKMQFEKGYLWEVALSKAFAEKSAVRIGEIEVDGIAMSPDGVDYDDDGCPVVEEYKCTAFSSNKRPTDVWKWMMQAKAYCRAVGAIKCIFRVLYLCGDYGEHRVPQYKVWEIAFTQGELDENWLSILAHAETMKGE